MPFKSSYLFLKSISNFFTINFKTKIKKLFKDVLMALSSFIFLILILKFLKSSRLGIVFLNYSFSRELFQILCLREFEMLTLASE